MPEILWHPAPTLHVDDEALDVFVACWLGTLFTIAAGFQQRLMQELELLMFGV